MANLSAKEAMNKLMAGNERFVNGSMEHPNQGGDRRGLLLKGQKPFACVIACSDSRVVPEMIFDTGLGDIFVIRTAGNVCDDLGLASIEYAVRHLAVDLVLVLGHTYCGAVTAVVEDQPLEGRMSKVRSRLKRAVLKTRNKSGDKLMNAILKNVELEVDRIRNTEPIISKKIIVGDTEVVGAVYVMDTGKVEIISD